MASTTLVFSLEDEELKAARTSEEMIQGVKRTLAASGNTDSAVMAITPQMITDRLSKIQLRMKLEEQLGVINVEATVRVLEFMITAMEKREALCKSKDALASAIAEDVDVDEVCDQASKNLTDYDAFFEQAAKNMPFYRGGAVVHLTAEQLEDAVSAHVALDESRKAKGEQSLRDELASKKILLSHLEKADRQYVYAVTKYRRANGLELNEREKETLMEEEQHAVRAQQQQKKEDTEAAKLPKQSEKTESVSATVEDESEDEDGEKSA